MADTGHTELEGFTLGIIWQHGPCSAYVVRRQFLDSPSTEWSGSAGAIYPLIRRLEKAGLITGAKHKQGRRASRVYSLTDAGLRALAAWLGPPLPPHAVTVSHDPLRSRMRFLGVLKPRQREAWIAGAEKSLAEVLDRVQRWDTARGAVRDVFTDLVTRNGELDVRGRLAWLREARDALSGRRA